MKKTILLLLAAVCVSSPVWADERIERLLKNDEEILKKLEAIQAELEVVKVRASQH